MKKIEAKIVADSKNKQGDRITTYLLTYPRFIHGEMMTHRMFSKNSASSRAIPFHKMVEMVETDPFIPLAWQKPHKGMQGTEYYDHTLTEEVGELDYKNLPRRWLRARDTAVSMAKIMVDERGNMPITKQLANRLLEPFMWHTVLLTGTEFENFFELRCPSYQFGELTSNARVWKSKKEAIRDFPHWENNTDLFWLTMNKSQAEIHIQALAEAMWDAMNESTPKELKAGEWHIPFGDKIQLAYTDYDFNGIITNEGINKKLKISTARCARLSYMTFDGEIDYEKDIKLHDTLLESQHMSPFEHCAKAMGRDYDTFIKGELTLEKVSQNFQHYKMDREARHNIGWCNNYKGFIQYRYLIENDYENNNKFY